MESIELGIKNFFQEKKLANKILVMAIGKSSEEITELDPELFSNLVHVMSAAVAAYMVSVMEIFAKEKHTKDRKKVLKMLDLTPAKVGKELANANPLEQEGVLIASYIINTHRYAIEKALLAFLPNIANPGIS